MMTDAIGQLKSDIRRELTEGIIPFWKGLMDNTNGGYCSYLSYDLVADRSAPHGCILNSRILWFFSSAYIYLRDDALLRAAAHAYEYMHDVCTDREYGGVYWSMNIDGTPEDTTKHTYNQAFAIYALSAYYEASRKDAALDDAIALYHIIEDKCRDAEGYLEAYTRDFVPAGNDKLSENGVEATRTMNTALHVLEAYTAFCHALKSARDIYGGSADTASLCEEVRDKLRFLLDIFATRIYNPERRRQEVFFDRDYATLIDLHSYGHDIESSWLIDRALEVLGDLSYRDRLSPITRTLAQETLMVAFDGRSMANECERGVVNEKRIWWVQAETMIGFINAYDKAARWGDTESADKFMRAALSEWAFIKEYVADSRPGSEWFSELSADGAPIEGLPIVDPWKCPYHNGRMCLELLHRLEG